MQLRVLIAWALLVWLLAACSPVEPLALPTETPTQTPLPPTATIDWFPATATPIPSPTQARTPTPELRAGIGGLLLEDDFSDPDEWSVYEVANGKVTVVNNHITLALNQNEGLIYGFRPSPLVGDFYAEITASPNYCRGQDEYGLMVRINGNRLNHYRFAVSCDGQAEVVRVYNNKGNVYAEWVRDLVIPAIAPSESVLAVWAQKEEIRFFINGKYLFSIQDTVLGQGALGVYVRASGGGPISVNFSDLKVYALEE